MAEHYKYVVHGKLTDPLMDIINIFYVRFESEFVPTGVQASGYLSDLYGTITAEQPTTFSLQYLGVSHWTGPSDGIWWDETTNPPGPKANPPWGVEQALELSEIVGEGVTEVLPPQVAGLVYAKTNTKHVIARKFVGPLLESSQNKGSLTTAALAALTAFGEQWKIAWQGQGGPPGTAEVWGYRRGFNTLTTVVADSVVATNRRRKPGRGS